MVKQKRERTNEIVNDVSWASIIPLIGGSAIGISQYTNTKPKYSLSYSGFSFNESYFQHYWPDVPRYEIDDEEFKIDEVQKVDVINSVCPCAGLSGLSAYSSADNEMNDWLYNSSEYILEHSQPKVLWGENAPALATKKGRKVAERLAEIGRKHGYSYSMIKTNTFEHGIPQNRKRTFFFFWKSLTAPILNFHQYKTPTLSEYLKQIPKDATQQDLIIQEKPSDSYEYKFIMEMNGYKNHKELVKDLKYSTLTYYILDRFGYDKYFEWLGNQSEQTDELEKSRRRFKHYEFKNKQNLNFMDRSPCIAYKSTNAINGRTLSRYMHPTEDRYFTIRELLHLMGLPMDFELKDYKQLNVICQNVPTVTTEDMMKEVVRFCRNDKDMVLAPANFLIQDNMNKCILESRMIWD